MIDNFVSVLMPVYNAEKYLEESIDSILQQSHFNFEFIIINDGSNDSSLDILNSYSDARMIIVNNTENLGLIKSLNLGLSLCKGDYIFRMDADDISSPNRIEKQLHFMLASGVDICGTWFTLFKDNICGDIVKHKIGHYEIKFDLIYNSSLGHPTVAFNRNILDTYLNINQFYSEDFPHAEDYELWTRLIFDCKFDNFPNSLLLYRVHSTQVSSVKSDEQVQLSDLIKTTYLNRLFPNNFDSNRLLSFFSGNFFNNYGCVSFLKIYLQLLHSNFTHKQFPVLFFFVKLNKLAFRSFYVCRN